MRLFNSGKYLNLLIYFDIDSIDFSGTINHAVGAAFILLSIQEPFDVRECDLQTMDTRERFRHNDRLLFLNGKIVSTAPHLASHVLPTR